MPFITRRAFLILLATGGFAGVAAKLLIRTSSAPRQIIRTSSLSEDVSTGSLSRNHLKILLAMTQAITQQQTLQGHYEDYFNWRSQNLKGYKQRYERYCELLNHKSLEMTKRNFSDNSPTSRLQIINSLRPYLKDKIDRGRFNAGEKELFDFETNIIQETLQLFARTDALLALGYISFPGQARGFDTYRKLPASI